MTLERHKYWEIPSWTMALLVAAPLAAQVPPALAQVTAWRMSFTLSASGSGKAVNGSGTPSETTSEFTYSVNAHGTALLDYRKDGSWNWTGQPDVTVSARYTGKKTYKNGSSYADEFAYDGPPRVNTPASAHLSFLNQQGYGVMLGDEQIRVAVKTTTVSPPSPTRVSTALVNVNWSPIWTQRVPYPQSSTVLTGVLTGKYHAPILHGNINDDAYDLVFVANYRFEPVLDEILLEVTSPDYETWRPSAEPGPKAGKSIQFTATVKRASGQPAQVTVDRFVWELMETSREPGIALNFPLLNPDDGETDLKLDPQPGQLATGGNGQKVERFAPPSVEDRAVVLPYDWGGWSTMQVTAYLTDGRKLVGKYKGSQEEHVRLPKRAKDSFIAEGWKKETGASGADQDDNEKEPVGEPGCDGDGLTLYEEYRGFYENGKHIEGNPKRKDLFIFNGCGAVAEPGISLFGSLTGLELHKDLLEDERNLLNGEYTAINGNFAKGPHRVLQHRVEVTNCGFTRSGGAGTRAVQPGYASDHHLRPKDVENIYVERPDSRYWIQQYGVSSDDQPRQFDVALAHELLHAVGVEHHGEGDNSGKFEAHRADHRDNPTGHPTWLIWGTSTLATFLDEASGVDITESTASRALQVLATVGQLAETDPVAAQALYEGPEWFVQKYQIGVENGQGSGDETCVMRYWLSDVYPKKGAEETWYMVPPGTEPVGTQICSSTTGKTINVAGRSPQPRYFDAASTRGNCKFWVCVNDAIPGKSSGVPEKSQ